MNKGTAMKVDEAVKRVPQIKIKILHRNQFVRSPYEPNSKLKELIDYLKNQYFPEQVFHLIGNTIFSEQHFDQTLSELQITEQESIFLIIDDLLVSDDFDQQFTKFLEFQKQERAKFIKNRDLLEQQQKKILDAVQVHGRIQVAFLIDGTRSMDPNAFLVMSTVEAIASQVHSITKRKLLWSAVVYQDYSEKALNGGFYKELRITDNPKVIVKFVQEHEFIGGEDVCKDIEGGLNQVLNLKWVEQYKIIVVVCDAPCHGREYNGGCEDFHPNEKSIINVLKEIIMKDIVLVMVTFNTNTNSMIIKFRKIFQMYSRRPDSQFMHLNVMDVESQKITEMIKIQLTRTISGTAVRQETRTINQNENETTIQVNYYSALQLLNSDTQIKSTNKKFEVFSIQLIDKDLQTIICKPEIQNLRVTFQTSWKMYISDEPFNSGSVRNVYILKKEEGGNEQYVSKCPRTRRGFRSLEEALKDCLVHVIAQEAFSQFQSQLNNLIQEGLQIEQNQGLPKAQFAQLLILKENDACFWIAERYMNGVFVKFNSNQGYINGDLNNRFNLFAQAFTMFTYNNTLNNSLICDIQGFIKQDICYYTDPAILTAIGRQTQTDLGQKGIDQYLTTYENSEKPGQIYLEHLTI